MPRTILGLDIGSHAIKAVLIETSLRGFQVADYFELSVPPGRTESALPPPRPAAPAPEEPRVEGSEGTAEEPTPPEPAADEALAGFLRGFFAEQGIACDEVVVAAPAPFLVHRLVTLPFTQKKKIDLVLKDEVGDQLPFEMEDLHHDVQPMAREDGKTHLLVSLIDPARFRSFIETLRAAGIEARAAEIPENALVRAALLSEPAPIEPTAVIDLGASKSTLVLHDGTRFRGMRTIPVGGRAATDAIARALGLPLDEAERLKGTQARLVGPEEAASEPARRVSDAIEAALAPLATGLLQALHAAEVASSFTPARVLLCGGGANLPGIDRWLARVLDVPVRRMAPLDAPGVQRKIAAGPDRQAVMALALGLAMRPLSPRARKEINLCRGEFAPRARAAQLQSRLRELTVMAAVLVLLLAGKAFMGYRTYAGQAEVVDRQVREIFTKAFPGQPPVQPAKQFADNIAAVKARLALVGGLGEGGLTALGVLREISARIPRTVRVDVGRIEIAPDVVRIEGTTDDFNSVDKIEAELGKIEGFLSIKKDQTTKVAGDKIKFKFIIGLSEARPQQAGVGR